MDQIQYLTYQFFVHIQRLLDVFLTLTNQRAKRKIHDLHYVDQHRCPNIYDVVDDHVPKHTNNSK